MLQKTQIIVQILCILLTLALIGSMFLPLWNETVKDPETKENKEQQVSLVQFTWFPSEHENLLHVFDGDAEGKAEFKAFYQSGSSSAALAQSIFGYLNKNKGPETFRDLEGIEFIPHLASLNTGLTFFSGSVWMLVFSVVSLVLFIFYGPRSKAVYAYFMVLTAYLTLVFAINNPFVRTGILTPQYPTILLGISIALLVASLAVIVLFFVERKARKTKAQAA